MFLLIKVQMLSFPRYFIESFQIPMRMRTLKGYLGFDLIDSFLYYHRLIDI